MASSNRYAVPHSLRLPRRSNAYLSLVCPSDAISSIVALVGVVGSQNGIPWLDPVAGLAVGAMIVKMGVGKLYLFISLF